MRLVAAAVEAEQLVKRHRGRGGAVEAVRGVDLEVTAGEVFGFLGPNGAGKSTTVQMLTALSITAGSARVVERHWLVNVGLDILPDICELDDLRQVLTAPLDTSCARSFLPAAHVSRSFRTAPPRLLVDR